MDIGFGNRRPEEICHRALCLEAQPVICSFPIIVHDYVHLMPICQFAGRLRAAIASFWSPEPNLCGDDASLLSVATADAFGMPCGGIPFRIWDSTEILVQIGFGKAVSYPE